MITSFIILFGALAWFHAIADFPLQGPFLSQAKNRLTPVPGFPWTIAMLNHCVIHAGFVWLVTGNLLLGLIELVVHFYIDDQRCRSRLTAWEDQMYHYGWKVLYALIIAVFPSWSFWSNFSIVWFR